MRKTPRAREHTPFSLIGNDGPQEQVRTQAVSLPTETEVSKDQATSRSGSWYERRYRQREREERTRPSLGGSCPSSCRGTFFQTLKNQQSLAWTSVASASCSEVTSLRCVPTSAEPDPWPQKTVSLPSQLGPSSGRVMHRPQTPFLPL